MSSKKGESKEPVAKKDEKQEKRKQTKRILSPAEMVDRHLRYLERAVVTRDNRPILRVLRYTVRIRRGIRVEELRGFLEKHTPTSEIETAVSGILDTIEPLQPAKPYGEEAQPDAAMTDDETAPASGDAEGDATAPKEDDSAAKRDESTHHAVSARHPRFTAETAPEREAYLYYLAIMLLVKHKQWSEAESHAQALVEYGLRHNRRSLDHFTARASALVSLAAERLGRLHEWRPSFLQWHRTACLRHDEISQVTLVPILLRSYILEHRHAQAQSFLDKVHFPEQVSNSQLVRYLFYRGKLEAVQLQYDQAYANLLQALRKAPTNTGWGFKRLVQKTLITVQLLMGDIPERHVFSSGGGASTGDPGMAKVLRPYLELTQAVRVGDLSAFAEAVETHKTHFQEDDILRLVKRLRQTVIKAGLRKIARAYSRISFDDIAEKLRLDGPEDAAFVCARAIRDGVIDAILDHSSGSLRSKPTPDVYTTAEPQEAFHRRIAFCLDVRNEAVRSMEYPPGAFKRDKGAEDSKRLLEADEAEIADALERGEDFEDDED